jgi:hypothetical protein
VVSSELLCSIERLEAEAALPVSGRDRWGKSFNAAAPTRRRFGDDSAPREGDSAAGTGRGAFGDPLAAEALGEPRAGDALGEACDGEALGSPLVGEVSD